MKINLKCDCCGKDISVDYSDEDIKSMEACGVQWREIAGRCERCQAALEDRLGYRERPKAEAPAQMPGARTLSAQEVRERLPLATLAKSGAARCAACGEDYNSRWLDENGLCPKCADGNLEQGNLL